MLLSHKHLDYLKALKGIVSILRDPSDVASIFEITKGLRETDSFRRMIETIRSEPQCSAIVQQRYNGPLANLDELLTLPPESLGYQFATKLRQRGLDVVFYPVIEIRDDVTYVEQRLRQTHDIWHTVTGIGITPAEELGLQAFMLAQLMTPLSAILIGGGLLRSLAGNRPPGLETAEIMDAVARGWQLGRSAEPLFAQRWEEGWARPLAEWRRALRLPEPAN